MKNNNLIKALKIVYLTLIIGNPNKYNFFLLVILIQMNDK
jgi:hypothetical protein